jgi:pimeloyl-ACP methyl ester carboxylesterase
VTIFILVHGSWHDGWCWDGVATLLRGSGHVVHAPDLVGLDDDGTDLAGVTLTTWRDQIVALVDAAAEPVVLVGHSRGGIVISAVAEARPTGSPASSMSPPSCCATANRSRARCARMAAR